MIIQILLYFVFNGGRREVVVYGLFYNIVIFYFKRFYILFIFMNGVDFIYLIIYVNEFLV